ncbi:MAG: class II aldolase/adducin family protein [Planctomycetota bacterium]
MVDEATLRDELATVARRTYDAGYAAATDGNVSARLSAETLLISPSGCCLGELQPDELIPVDLDGRARLESPGRRPTSEFRMHLAVYQARPDVSAVLHAHPPITIAFSIAGESLEPCIIPEVVVGLGTIPTVDYTTPTTPETAAAVGREIARRDALVLQNHGTVTVGRRIVDAFYKLDKVEHSARILLAARQLGEVSALPPHEVERLLGMRETMGLPPIVPSRPNPAPTVEGHPDSLRRTTFE